jgi:hypothetical protein
MLSPGLSQSSSSKLGALPSARNSSACTSPPSTGRPRLTPARTLDAKTRSSRHGSHARPPAFGSEHGRAFEPRHGSKRLEAWGKPRPEWLEPSAASGPSPMLPRAAMARPPGRESHHAQRATPGSKHPPDARDSPRSLPTTNGEHPPAGGSFQILGSACM